MRIVGPRDSRTFRIGVLQGELVFDVAQVAPAAGRPALFLMSMAEFLDAESAAEQNNADLAEVDTEKLGTLSNRFRV